MNRDEAPTIGVGSGDTMVPAVWIVILNYNGAQRTIDCVDSLLRFDQPDFRVVIVDNASSDDSVRQLKANLGDPRVELLVNDENEGYAGGSNRGIGRALSDGAEYVLVLNNDTVVHPGCISSLLQAMEADSRIAIGGCDIADPEHGSSSQGEQINLLTARVIHLRHRAPVLGPVDVNYVCGAAMMLRAEAVRRIGAFDANLFMYCEDADLCFRAREAGYRVCFIPGPGVRHLYNCTAGRAEVRPLVYFYSGRNHIWMVRRYGNVKQQIVFTLLFLCYTGPRALLAITLRGQFDLLLTFLKVLWYGHLRYKPYLHNPSWKSLGPQQVQSKVADAES